MKRTLIAVFLGISVISSHAFQVNGSDEKVVIGQTFEVGENEVLSDLVVIGASGSIRGRVHDLVVIGSKVSLEAGSQVTGELVSLGTFLERKPGSNVTAKEVTVLFPSGGFKVSDVMTPFAFSFGLGWALLGLLFIFAFGVVFVQAAPELHNQAMIGLKQFPLGCVGIGLLAHILLVPVAVALGLTIIGIPFIPLYVLAFGVLIMMGHFVAASMLGTLIPLQKPLHGIVALAAGLVALKVVAWIPFIGVFVTYAVTAAGLGAVLNVLFDRWKRRKEAR